MRERFGAAVEAALAGALPPDWAAAPLAGILLLDQFTRNIFRGTPRAFGGDPLARALARSMLDAGADRTLPPVQRVFVYLPLEHAEDLALQDESVRLFAALAPEHPDGANHLDYAERHRDVIRRFGRFPHRNPILGRESTPDEQAYLATPGAGF